MALGPFEIRISKEASWPQGLGGSAIFYSIIFLIDMNHEQLEKAKTFKLGASQFGVSNRCNKRFYVFYNNKIIHMVS
jgi:hypothetical protein